MKLLSLIQLAFIIFLPFIFYPMLAFGDAQYQGDAV